MAGDWWPADYRGPQLISFDADLPQAFGVGTLGAWLVVRRVMGLDWVFMPGVAVAVALGAMALTLAFRLAGTRRRCVSGRSRRCATSRTQLPKGWVMSDRPQSSNYHRNSR